MPFSRFVARFAGAALLGACLLPAHGATLTVDIPGCSTVALGGTGSNYTLTCTQNAQTCAVNATPASPAGGAVATLTVACSPAAASVAWQASRDCTTPGVVSGSPLLATVSESGGRSCVYTATADGGGQASVPLVWSGVGTTPPPPPASAPTGCSITRTPTSGALGASGGNISMSVNCTGGGTVTSRSWRKNATTGWSSLAAPTDTLPANTAVAQVTYTYGVTACAGTACANEVTTTFTVAGSAPVGFCSQYNDVRFAALSYGGYVDTAGTGGGGPLVTDAVLVATLVVPVGTTSPRDLPGAVSVVGHQGAEIERIITISSQPCDFRGLAPGYRPPDDPTQANGPLIWGSGVNPQTQYLLQGDPSPGFGSRWALLTPGATYYLNIRNIRISDLASTCGSSTCDARITVLTPN